MHPAISRELPWRIGAVAMPIAAPSGKMNIERRVVAPAVGDPNVRVCARRWRNSTVLSPALPVWAAISSATYDFSSAGRIMGDRWPNHAAIPSRSTGGNESRETKGSMATSMGSGTPPRLPRRSTIQPHAAAGITRSMAACMRSSYARAESMSSAR
ncbi:MAG TPA: hypothetical protein VJV22_18150 [Acidobacteriaceae bacterium]|nr:hypothetical protein [Acidobacteriaceae bacterium]